MADTEAPREAAPSPQPPTTLPGLYVCRRFHVRPVIADLVASLAGIGPDRRAA
jgi:hypothetical protein